MGGGTSKNSLVLECHQLFSEEEKEQIAKVYKQICDKNLDGFSQTDLLDYGRSMVSEQLLGALFNYMKGLVQYEPGSKQNDLLVSDEELLVSLAHILKGSPEHKTSLVLCLCTGNTMGPVKTLQLKQFLENFMESFGLCQNGQPSLASWTFPKQRYHDAFIRTLLQDLIYKDSRPQCEVGEEFPWESAHSTDAVEKWLSGSALILRVMKTVFDKIFPTLTPSATLPESPLVPVADSAPWSRLSTLLDLPSLLYLNQALPQELRSPWRFLFSTSLHGESFSTMMKHVVDKGPSVVLVEDTDGHVFGGFASESWSLTSQFIGGSQCFLFSLCPVMDVYQSTGYNDHYMYMNIGQETIPNGLGMGGQFGYFGLWLDYEFGVGHSKAQPRCTTYGSPQLSHKPDFAVKTLEVWGVGPEPKKHEKGEWAEVHGSVLDKDPEAKAMLTLLDRGPRSEGLREEDPTADIPEQHSLNPSTS